MANIFKKVIDRMMWVSVPPLPTAHSAAVAVCSDLRSDISRNPFVYQLASNTVLNRYNIVTKGSNFVQSPALTGTFGAGAAVAFAPSFGVVGTIAAGATTTSVVLSTALATAVGVNMLANRGGSGDRGFKLRIIDTVAGKTAERYIIANTGGTTPTITVESSFGFTPATGARYEIVAGRVFMLGAAGITTNIWRSLEVATNTLSSGLSTTNLPATIGTDSHILVLDEQYTPYDCNPGDGFIKGAYNYDTGVVQRFALTATASAAGNLTGQASAGDAVIAANEFRNFQIRIVEDTVNTTAVGQRRIISSHTAGPSPVYTLGGGNWTVTPSSSAKFVIEYPNLIVVRSTATTTTYTYNYMDATINNGTNSIATNSWSTAYFAVGSAANAAGGFWIPSFGIRPDIPRNSRHSFCYYFRGGNTATVDLFDIAGGTTGAWTANIVIDGAVTMNTGSCAAYAPFGQEGRMGYINSYVASGISQIFRFDVKHRVLSPYAPTDDLQAGTAAVGNRLAAYVALDGTDVYDVVLLQSHLVARAQELIPLV
jgi:hypothetical protein